MFVVIFRARIREADGEYARVAERLRELALTQFGCLEHDFRPEAIATHRQGTTSRE